MHTPESLNTESKNLFNLISKNWEELDDSLKTKLIKIYSLECTGLKGYMPPKPKA